MLQVYIILFGWCFFVADVQAEGTNKYEKKDHTEISLLDKQTDYKITFERIEILRYDKHYIKMVNAVTFKYNRTCPVVNASLVYNVDVGNNVDVICQVYKFASNEYRLFPIRFQFNLCQAVSKNIMGIADWSKCGSFDGCHLRKNKVYSFCNWAPNPAMFPPLIPNGQYKLQFQIMHLSSEMAVLNGYGTVSRPIQIPK